MIHNRSFKNMGIVAEGFTWEEIERGEEVY